MKKKVFWILAVIALVGVIVWHRSQISEDEKDAIKIGAVISLSGKLSHVGALSLNALKLAEENYNANLSEGALPLKIIIEDGGSDSNTAIMAYKKLVNHNNIEAVITGGTAMSMPIASYMKAQQNEAKPQIGVYATHSELTKINPWTFRLYYPAGYEAEQLIDKIILKQPNYKKIALFYSMDDYGLTYRHTFDEYMPYNNLEFTAAEYDTTTKDFRTDVLKMQKFTPDVCVFTGLSPNLAMLIHQAKQDGLKCKYLTTSTIVAPGIYDFLEEAAEGLTFTLPQFEIETNTDSPKEVEFRKSYQEKYSIPATSYYTAFPYAAVEVLMEVLPGLSRNAGVEAVTAAMHEKIKDFDTAAGKLTVTEDRDMFIPLLIVQIQDGKKVVIER